MEHEAQDTIFDEWLREAQRELERKQRKARVAKVANTAMYVGVIVLGCVVLHIINTLDETVE